MDKKLHQTLPMQPLHIDRRKYGLKVRDVFFAKRMDQIDMRGIDIVYSVQCSEPSPGCTEFNTSIVDLRQPSEAIYNAISKGFRYEIRRSEKDTLRIDFIDQPNQPQIERFATYFGSFARSKGIADVNFRKLLKLAKVNGLNLAWVHGSEPEQPLAAHAYIVDGERARLYYSGSTASNNCSVPLRQLAGRANKLLHWYCIQQFQLRGYLHYDLGGISMSEALKTIDEFKQQFGGVLVKEFNVIASANLAGRCALDLLQCISRFMGR